MQAIDLIISGGYVITMDGRRRIIENGAVAVAADRILFVGTAEEVHTRFTARRTIDASGKVVMPGLIDVHAHAGHGLIKTMGMEQENFWEETCHKAYLTGSTPEFWFAEAQLAALERLRFGVTCGVSLLGGGDTIMRTDDRAYADAHCEGVSAVGTRSVVALGPTRPPHPRTYATWKGEERTDRPVTFDTQFKVTAAALKNWLGRHGMRINIALLTPVLRDEHARSLSAADYADAIDQTRKVRALSREAGVVFTQDGHWRGSIIRAAEMGILGPDALFSHAIDITPEEVALCAETGTRIAHNPSAIASIMGRCPVIELLDAGAVVAIGSDATAPDRSADMFRHMQQCMHYHRTFFKDPKILPPGKALEMTTIDAAVALGMDRHIGSLETGKKADIILVDMARPHLRPLNMQAFHVVYFANGNDVHTVIVDGNVVLDGGVPTRVSQADILDAADRECRLMIERTGTAHLLGMPEGFFGRSRYPS